MFPVCFEQLTVVLRGEYVSQVSLLYGLVARDYIQFILGTRYTWWIARFCCGGFFSFCCLHQVYLCLVLVVSRASRLACRALLIQS